MICKIPRCPNAKMSLAGRVSAMNATPRFVASFLVEVAFQKPVPKSLGNSLQPFWDG